MSRTLSMNCGSGDSLNASVWCGLSPNARQILLIADWLIPVACAIERVDQCVASGGCPSSVLTITRSMSSSPIERGLPGRGSSCSPSSPRRAKRPRHLPTVSVLQPSRAAFSLLDAPSAAANTIRQRSASACALDGRRAQRTSTSRSSSPTTTSTRCGTTTPIVGDNDDGLRRRTAPTYELTTQMTRPRSAQRRSVHAQERDGQPGPRHGLRPAEYRRRRDVRGRDARGLPQPLQLPYPADRRGLHTHASGGVIGGNFSNAPDGTVITTPDATGC